MPAYADSNALFVYDTTPEDDRVHRLLLGQMRRDFPVTFSDLGSRIVAENRGNQAIEAYRSLRTPPGRSFAFSLSKTVQIVYDRPQPTRCAREPYGATRTRSGVASDFVSFAPKRIVDLRRPVHDSEYRKKKNRLGHGASNTVVDPPRPAEARNLPHDPMHPTIVGHRARGATAPPPPLQARRLRRAGVGISSKRDNTAARHATHAALHVVAGKIGERAANAGCAAIAGGGAAGQLPERHSSRPTRKTGVTG
jgi:hypothetical protein